MRHRSQVCQKSSAKQMNKTKNGMFCVNARPRPQPKFFWASAWEPNFGSTISLQCRSAWRLLANPKLQYHDLTSWTNMMIIWLTACGNRKSLRKCAPYSARSWKTEGIKQNYLRNTWQLDEKESLSGTGDSQRDSHESIRASHAQLKPYFYSASGRFGRITRISDSRESRH